MSTKSSSDASQSTTNENVNVYGEEGATVFSLRDGGTVHQAVSAEELELFKAVLETAEAAGQMAVDAASQSAENAIKVIEQEGENQDQTWSKLALPLAVVGAVAWVAGKVMD